jgi:hypothetical protein
MSTVSTVALTVIIDQRGRAAHRHAAAGAGHDHRQVIFRKPTSGNIVVRHLNAKLVFDKIAKSFHFLEPHFLFVIIIYYNITEKSTVVFRRYTSKLCAMVG